MHPAILRCCLLTALATPAFAAPPASFARPSAPGAHVKAADIHPERELLITDPAVLDSQYAQYPGPWSFGSLMEEIFGKELAPEAIHKWLLLYAEESAVGQAPQCISSADFQAASATVGVKALGLRAKEKRADTTSGAVTIPARPDVVRKFIHDWQQRDGYDSNAGQPWEPNLAHAPFRLLAIVNRMDLGVAPLVKPEDDLRTRWINAGKEEQLAGMVGLSTLGVHGIRAFDATIGTFGGYRGFGSGGSIAGLGRFRGQLAGIPTNCGPVLSSDSSGPSLGEGRLVFGAVSPDGQPLPGGWTIIFEYKLEPLSKVGAIRTGGNDALIPQDWAQAWHYLGSLDLRDPLFAESLAGITRAFTHRKRNEQGEVEGNSNPAFSQLRSNEAAFGPGREFRQFDLLSGNFVPALLPLTPGPEFMNDRQTGGRLLGTFLNEIEPLVRAGVHSVPKTMEFHRTTVAMQGATALIPDGEKDFHWDPTPHVPRDARRLFSINTCNGCHAGDTGCPDGLHVKPRGPGLEAQLSNFLRRDGQPNKFQDPGLKTSYVRLTEMEDRAAILAALLEPKERRRLADLSDILRSRLRRSH